jgi:hypothetical protein
MADTYAEKKPGFVAFSPRRPITANALVPLSRLKVSSSTRNIKKGHPIISAASDTCDRANTQGTNEVQTLTITGTPTGGSFTVTSTITGYSRLTADNNFTGTTVAVAYNATAAVLQAALETILGVGNVVCAGGPFPGTACTITFQGELAVTNVAALSTTDSLTGGSTPASAISTTTAGVNGAITSTVIMGFSEMNDVSPVSQWPTSFPQAPLNLDGQYWNSGKPILIHPDMSGEIYTGAIWPTETVATSLVSTSTAYTIGYDVVNDCCYIRTGDTSTNAIVRIVGIPPGQNGVVGGNVDFMILDGSSLFH